MAHFSGEPNTIWVTQDGGDREMALLEDFSFTDRRGKQWWARTGDRIDGASIPRALWTLVGSPYVGDYRRASIVHDIACRDATEAADRRAADRMFYEACREGGCSVRASIVLYIGVRIGAAWNGQFLLQQERVEPRLVEPAHEKEVRALFQDVADRVLEEGEVDDAAIVEARVDGAEKHAISVRLAYAGAAAFAAPREKSEAFLAGESDPMLGPDHPPLSPAGEQFYDDKLLDEPCGGEDRTPCENTATFPFSAVCYLVLNKSFGRSSYGTGFFIAPDTIVTAGHCLRSGVGSVRSIQVIAGRRGSEWPFGSVMAREWFVPEEWRRRGDERFDYGVVKLDDSSLGERTGHFEIGALTDEELAGVGLTTSGYPSDMDPSTVQHTNSGPCGDVEPQRLNYLLDTWRGASGSPVWIERDGRPLVVGIHNYGHCPNKATRINARVLADLRAWIGRSS